ncbi:CIA30 family protein [Gloeocapsopsis dulcis]|uniref:NADH:ubiquinone oxidoreductase n=1 Tax=Gloeocapsopsis dulcis AAB1 = 1H9 TaxID=1433147 RepID=A0A6N8FWS6_9CHRO|nr:CIA30 family protein [Gloeocapsopsis dulcis]MUL36755.1 NADH:ubiquinone oxidoreductase [Gloeocapsopsis dulcis AAB1 = 1H9]WNN91327.1 CIA30 family protein [Gloeocapsopsis dulcis]
MTETNRSQWDLGRFVQTLTFFEVIPFIGWLQRFIPGSQDSQVVSTGEKRVGVVLVAGATGGVGRRVVQRLIDRGYKVRSLVRDAEKAKEILGDNVELYVGDITKPEITLEMMADVTAVICCTAVRVQPVEGDTPDRAKYNQGVKFYQPEIVGDTPEVVEYLGVKNLVEVAAQHFATVPSDKIIFDFAHPSEELKRIWGAVDDVVMGGVSQSEIRFVEDTALFTGNVSTANSGGFASVRTKNLEPKLNLSGYQGIKLRVRGDGKRYKCFIRTDTKWDGTAYSYSFDTVSNTWIDVCIPFADLTAVFRAKTLKDAPAIDPSKIASLQLMLSKFEYDGELNPKFTSGGFALQVESIKAYGGAKLPQFILVSSAGVTRPGRPGINLEEQPPAVRLNDQLGGILTWKWRGEESLRHCGIPYTIIRPCALTEESGVQPLVFDQGDNIKGKVSRDSIAELCLQVLEQPEACNVTFEVKAESSTPTSSENSFSHLQPD